MYVNAFIVNVNKCLKPFFLEQHINIVNTAMLQIFWFFCRCSTNIATGSGTSSGTGCDFCS